MPKISAIIMASGRSTRMGRCKLSLPFADSTVLETFIGNMPHKLFTQVILVTGENLNLSTNENITKIINQHPSQGQSRALNLGLEKVEPENAAMCFVADQPLLSSKIITELIDLHTANPDKIILPTVNGKNKNPVIFPAKFHHELKLLTGDIGGRVVIKNNLDNVIKFIIPNEDAWQFIDIDDKNDYYKLQGIWKSMKN